MAEIFNISKEDSDRWHAKKAVDKFLDSNKMYSHLGVDIFMIPEFMNMRLGAMLRADNIYAAMDNYDGKVKITIAVGDEIDRKAALALGYCLAVDFYNKQEIESKIKNYERTFAETYLDENGNISKTTFMFLGEKTCRKLMYMDDEMKKKVVQKVVENNYGTYSCALNDDFMDNNDPLTKKYRYFAEELVSRDCTNRFLPDKNRNKNQEYEF